MTCKKCGSNLSEESKYCKFCGEPILSTDESNHRNTENKIGPDDSELPVSLPQTGNTTKPFKVICLLLIIVCGIIWYASPFVAINYLTLDNQPTAWQLITDDVPYIGDLSGEPEIIAAYGTIIGIGICLLCLLARWNTGVSIIALITELPLCWELVKAYHWANGDLEDILSIIGYGFWLIAALLVVIAIASFLKPPKETATQD